jgi:GNAT superfamily N-acetyltransferase
MIEYKVLNSSSEELEDFSFPFAKLLFDAVQEGASMGYLLSTPISAMEEFWSSILRNVSQGSAVVLYAIDDREIVAVVVLQKESNPNAAHRAEVKKLIVRSDKRGQGIARKLLTLIEMEARIAGRSLLILDTETDSDAQYLYEKLGWVRLGVMPNHSALPNGELRPTTYFYKELD